MKMKWPTWGTMPTTPLATMSTAAIFQRVMLPVMQQKKTTNKSFRTCRDVGLTLVHFQLHQLHSVQLGHALLYGMVLICL